MSKQTGEQMKSFLSIVYKTGQFQKPAYVEYFLCMVDTVNLQESAPKYLKDGIAAIIIINEQFLNYGICTCVG